jgi:hypothetical protein
MKIFWIAALALLIGACASGRKTYPNDLPDKNVSVRPSLSGVRAALHIHGVDAQCKTEYLGTVDLDRTSVPVALPAGRMSYLVFDFSGSSFLRGSHSISSATLLRPRPAHRYEIDASYKSDIYNVAIREVPPKGATREVPLVDFASCNSAK